MSCNMLNAGIDIHRFSCNHTSIITGSIEFIQERRVLLLEDRIMLIYMIH